MSDTWNPYEPHTCPDCGVVEGRYHRPLCDMAICNQCGEQYLSCDCPPSLKRRARFIEWPLLCARCGTDYPDFFMVPTAQWKRVIQKDQRGAVVCKSCFDYLTRLQQVPYRRPHFLPGFAHPTAEAEALHAAWLDTLPREEEGAMMTEALALGAQFQAVIAAYCDSHPETSYGLLIEATRYTRWCLEQEMHENTLET